MSETEYRMVYDGEHATRRHVRTECADYVASYAGPRGSERLVRMAFNNGQVKLFEGARRSGGTTTCPGQTGERQSRRQAAACACACAAGAPALKR